MSTIFFHLIAELQPLLTNGLQCTLCEYYLVSLVSGHQFTCKGLLCRDIDAKDEDWSVVILDISAIRDIYSIYKPTHIAFNDKSNPATRKFRNKHRMRFERTFMAAARTFHTQTLSADEMP